jgi:hypothetical protein
VVVCPESLKGAFVAEQVSRSGTFELWTDATQSLGLFTPEGEKQWAAHWDFEQVYSDVSPTSDTTSF